MKNPWFDISEFEPYLLPQDKEIILSRNEKLKEIHQIKHNIFPEPYIGNPDAPIILLVLNPGYNDEDIFFYKQKQVPELWRNNIFHKPMDYPFWMIDPSLNPNIGGTKWWLKKLKEPINLVGLEKVANRICCIEYFPYHSRRYASFNPVLESQKYGFHLVEKAMQKNATIVLMRSKLLWFESIPKLKDYKFLFRLNSVQNVTLSRKNCPQGFPLIEKILTQ
ncbi:MAG: hypothetical protein JNK81_08150 [Anaerolineales bacterium]|nr:hypothetical protein [Anaerolineales bacterium]